MSDSKGCPIHGVDFEPEVCSFCLTTGMLLRVLDGEPLPETREPDRIEAKTTEYENGVVLVTYKPVWFDS